MIHAYVTLLIFHPQKVSVQHLVGAEMSLHLLLLLVLPLCVSSKQALLEETVNDDVDETMYKSEKLDNIEDKFEELEEKLETKNVEVENLQKRLKEIEVQFESRVEEVILRTQKKNHQEVASLKSEMKIQMADLQNQLKEVKTQETKMECKAEVKKELDKVLPTAVEQGLRDLPFEMVCAYRHDFSAPNSTISYDRITVEFNNSDHPGGLFV